MTRHKFNKLIRDVSDSIQFREDPYEDVLSKARIQAEACKQRMSTIIGNELASLTAKLNLMLVDRKEGTKLEEVEELVLDVVYCALLLLAAEQERRG